MPTPVPASVRTPATRRGPARGKVGLQFHPFTRGSKVPRALSSSGSAEDSSDVDSSSSSADDESSPPPRRSASQAPDVVDSSSASAEAEPRPRPRRSAPKRASVSSASVRPGGAGFFDSDSSCSSARSEQRRLRDRLRARSVPTARHELRGSYGPAPFDPFDASRDFASRGRFAYYERSDEEYLPGISDDQCLGTRHSFSHARLAFSREEALLAVPLARSLFAPGRGTRVLQVPLGRSSTAPDEPCDAPGRPHGGTDGAMDEDPDGSGGGSTASSASVPGEGSTDGSSSTNPSVSDDDSPSGRSTDLTTDHGTSSDDRSLARGLARRDLGSLGPRSDRAGPGTCRMGPSDSRGGSDDGSEDGRGHGPAVDRIDPTDSGEGRVDSRATSGRAASEDGGSPDPAGPEDPPPYEAHFGSDVSSFTAFIDKFSLLGIHELGDLRKLTNSARNTMVNLGGSKQTMNSRFSVLHHNCALRVGDTHLDRFILASSHGWMVHLPYHYAEFVAAAADKSGLNVAPARKPRALFPLMGQQVTAPFWKVEGVLRTLRDQHGLRYCEIGVSGIGEFATLDFVPLGTYGCRPIPFLRQFGLALRPARRDKPLCPLMDAIWRACRLVPEEVRGVLLHCVATFDLRLHLERASGDVLLFRHFGPGKTFVHSTLTQALIAMARSVRSGNDPRSASAAAVAAQFVFGGAAQSFLKSAAITSKAGDSAWSQARPGTGLESILALLYNHNLKQKIMQLLRVQEAVDFFSIRGFKGVSRRQAEKVVDMCLQRMREGSGSSFDLGCGSSDLELSFYFGGPEHCAKLGSEAALWGDLFWHCGDVLARGALQVVGVVPRAVWMGVSESLAVLVKSEPALFLATEDVGRGPKLTPGSLAPWCAILDAAGLSFTSHRLRAAVRVLFAHVSAAERFEVLSVLSPLARAGYPRSVLSLFPTWSPPAGAAEMPPGAGSAPSSSPDASGVALHPVPWWREIRTPFGTYQDRRGGGVQARGQFTVGPWCHVQQRRGVPRQVRFSFTALVYDTPFLAHLDVVAWFRSGRYFEVFLVLLQSDGDVPMPCYNGARYGSVADEVRGLLFYARTLAQFLVLDPWIQASLAAILARLHFLGHQVAPLWPDCVPVGCAILFGFVRDSPEVLALPGHDQAKESVFQACDDLIPLGVVNGGFTDARQVWVYYRRALGRFRCDFLRRPGGGLSEAASSAPGVPPSLVPRQLDTASVPAAAAGGFPSTSPPGAPAAAASRGASIGPARGPYQVILDAHPPGSQHHELFRRIVGTHSSGWEDRPATLGAWLTWLRR